MTLEFRFWHGSDERWAWTGTANDHWYGDAPGGPLPLHSALLILSKDVS